jgi:hypothetical protein
MIMLIGTQNAGFGQAAWNDGFARAYVRLSILGVADISKLTDCTKVLPNAVKNFTPIQFVPTNGTTSETTSSASSATVSPTGKFSNSSTTAYKTSSAPYSGYTTSTIYTTKIFTVTEKGTTKKSSSVYPVSTTVCKVSAKPTYAPTVAPPPPKKPSFPVSYAYSEVKSTPVAPVKSVTAAPVLSSSKPKACYTVTVTTTVY